MEENKKSKFGLGILIGLLIAIIIGLSAFIIYDKVLSKDNDNNDSQQVEENKNTETEEEKNEVNNNNSSNKNEAASSDFDISKFDTTKEAINGANGWAYEPVTNDNSTSAMGLSISLNENKKSATITIDWSKYFEIYGISATRNEIRKYEINNFTKNIKEVYIGGFGQASGHETAFYVMEDGTVEYTPINHALGNNGSSSETVLKSYGKIANVSGVVKVITATDYCPNSNINCMGGSYNILGIKADGTFYDLSKILDETNYYDNF